MKKGFLFAALAAAVAGVLVYTLSKKPAQAERAGAEPVKGAAAHRPAAAASNAASRAASASAGPKGTGVVATVQTLAPAQARGTNGVSRSEDQIAADLMQERLDNNDEAGALKVARTLMKSKEKAVRSQVVSSLGWVGVKALPELSQMLNDGDPDIEREVFQQWTASLNEIESEDMQQQMLISGMQTMQDLESLEESVMLFSQMDQGLAIRGLVQLVDSENALAASVARAHYEHMTGQEYTTSAAAEDFIKANATTPAPAPAAAAASKK